MMVEVSQPSNSNLDLQSTMKYATVMPWAFVMTFDLYFEKNATLIAMQHYNFDLS